MYSPNASDQRASLNPQHSRRFAAKSAHAITVEGLTPATFLNRFHIEHVDLSPIGLDTPAGSEVIVRVTGPIR